MAEIRLALPGSAGDDESLALRFDLPEWSARVGWSFLYLHGFGSRQSGEKANHFRAHALAAGVPFCSLDFRGHGESAGTLAGLTLSRNLEDVAHAHRFLAERGHPRVVLVGSSLGGATALAHARRDPRRVAACLLIAPAVGLRGEVERWAGPDRLAAWRRNGVIRYRSELVEADLAWSFVEDLSHHDYQEIARELATPTLILQGREDRSVDFRDVLDFVVSSPPGVVDLVLYGDGDHRLIDRKEELWQRMLEFLARRGLLAPLG